jgi:putative GTP pyrophosphokinase
VSSESASTDVVVHGSLISEGTAEVLEQFDETTLGEFKTLRDDFARFMMPYKFGIDEMTTKIQILREEFKELHDYNPIEHVSSRLKSPESLIEKVSRKGCEPTFEAMREQVTDIAGVRVVCSFVSDVYKVFDMLTAQTDVRVVTAKDYIAHPKPNGYKSLHAIVEVPVFLSTGPIPVYVELQVRTIAMDFWASLEHKIYYKYDRAVPQHLLDGLHEAAETASRLDSTMEGLHTQIRGPGSDTAPDAALTPGDLALQEFTRRLGERTADGNAQSDGNAQ